MWRWLPEQDPKRVQLGEELNSKPGDPPQASRTASMLLVGEGYEAFGVLVMETTDSLVQGKGLYHIQPFSQSMCHSNLFELKIQKFFDKASDK